MTTETESNAPVSAGHVLVRLLRDPWRNLALQWNWKSAIFSSLVRAQIFFWVTLRSGWRAACGAMLVELAYRGLTSGFYGAITQAFRATEPAWTGAVASMILLPLVSHGIEFVVHSVRHTPHLAANIITSVCFTVISTLFNWYAMRKGCLITGPSGKSVLGDFRLLPRVIAGFVAAGPIALWSWLCTSTKPEVWTLRESEDAACD